MQYPFLINYQFLCGYFKKHARHNLPIVTFFSKSETNRTQSFYTEKIPFVNIENSIWLN